MPEGKIILSEDQSFIYRFLIERYCLPKGMVIMLRKNIWLYMLLCSFSNLLFGQTVLKTSETKIDVSQLKSDFIELNKTIKIWWDKDIHTAYEKDIKEYKSAYGLQFLPFPYVSGGGSESFFVDMYGWDIYFVNMALLKHGRTDLVKNHILDQLFMIERYGYVVNGNNTGLITRSQPPFLALSLLEYFNVTKDTSLLYFAFPLLENEYKNYWNAPHHSTPIGLTTCRDMGDKGLVPILHLKQKQGWIFVLYIMVKYLSAYRFMLTAHL